MEDIIGCQIPCLPEIAEGNAEFDQQPFDKRVKRALAKPWNCYVKKIS
jgi:hypothetical protein